MVLDGNTLKVEANSDQRYIGFRSPLLKRGLDARMPEAVAFP